MAITTLEALKAPQEHPETVATLSKSLQRPFNLDLEKMKQEDECVKQKVEEDKDVKQNS